MEKQREKVSEKLQRKLTGNIKWESGSDEIERK